LAEKALQDLRQGRCTDLWDTEQPQIFGTTIGSCPTRFRNWQTDAMSY
jgi:hypothetical protein